MITNLSAAALAKALAVNSTLKEVLYLDAI